MLFVLALLFTPLFGGTQYIRAGATGAGTGTSWADAYPSFSQVKWVRGNTYYVAGGTYTGNVIVTKALSGSAWIVVKKANAADNGRDAGWNAAWATTPAVIAGTVQLRDGYIEFNGVTGGGTEGHGFQIKNPANTTVMTLGGSSGPYRIYHTEVRGTGFAAGGYAMDGIVSNNPVTRQKGLHIAYCWIHELTRNGVTFGGLVGTSYTDYGLLFEHNVISETGGSTDPAIHGQGMQIGFGSEDAFHIIRNNEFRNATGTGMIAWLGGAGSIHRDTRVYNNIFRITDASRYRNNSPGVIYAHINATACRDISICNNAFYGIGSPTATAARGRVMLSTIGAKNNVLANNIFERCYLPARHEGVTESANRYHANTGSTTLFATATFGEASTFVDAAAGDFRLVPGGYAVGVGEDLSTLFTHDRDGTPRGSTWDLGPLQFSASPVKSNLPLGTRVKILVSQ